MTDLRADPTAAGFGAEFHPTQDQIIAHLTEELRATELVVENLHGALRHSRSIGMAVGIIMATKKVTEAEGFRLLSICSQHLNRKVRDLAPFICETGSLPETPTYR